MSRLRNLEAPLRGLRFQISHSFSSSKTSSLPKPLPNHISTEQSKTPNSADVSAYVTKNASTNLQPHLRREFSSSSVAAATTIAATTIAAVSSPNYGDLDIHSDSDSTLTYTPVSNLATELNNQTVLIHGRAQTIRTLGNDMAFLIIRQNGSTVQCVVSVNREMVKYVKSLTRESIVDIEGVVSNPKQSIKGTTQEVEIHVKRICCVSKAVAKLPMNIEDAGRSEGEIDVVRVNQDTRLNYRFLDLRTSANRAIFSVEDEVENVFREYLRGRGFRGIHTPSILGGLSEGGAAVFRLDYKGKPACLAQSPQLHKQMSINGDFGRVFVVGPVFRAEDSFTHRHLCEFIGLDVEMEIEKNYSEVMDVVEGLFIEIFDHLNENCRGELEAIQKQYPFTPLKYLKEKSLRLTFEEGVQMLKEAGVEIDPLGDLSTEVERKLGQLVLEKYGTEFYILHRYPLAVRPFYTMPCADNPAYSNSFDVFIRGEEIISGSQRNNVYESLLERATECGIDVENESMKAYMDSFRCGSPPHGGFGAGLERVVMLFCGLNNIRKTSLYPRDPNRIAP